MTRIEKTSFQKPQGVEFDNDSGCHGVYAPLHKIGPQREKTCLRGSNQHAKLQILARFGLWQV